MRHNDHHQPGAGTGLPFEEPRPATRMHVIVMQIQRLSVEGEAGEPTWTEPDKDGEYVYWEDICDKLMQWIPVADRLPNDVQKFGHSQRVLVAVKCDNGVEIMSIDSYDTLSRSWIGYGDCGRHVTHWMQLPKFPA